MGDYLLKGYKMLGSVCEICDVGFLIKCKEVKYMYLFIGYEE